MDESSLPPPIAAALKYERACSLSDLRSSGGRALIRLSNGRGILLVQSRVSDPITAMDHMCYHHGGPMYDGDIEDVKGVQWFVLTAN
jgi:nitrite reductase/ring-hydroxylating ferredoxin subunit